MLSIAKARWMAGFDPLEKSLQGLAPKGVRLSLRRTHPLQPRINEQGAPTQDLMSLRERASGKPIPTGHWPVKENQ